MLGLKLVWKEDKSNFRGWVDYAWNKWVSTDKSLNFVAAYKEADYRDNMEEAGCPEDWDVRVYWRVVYLSYDFEDEYLPQDEYSVRKLRRHIKLKVALLGADKAAIERLRDEDMLEDWYLDAEEANNVRG